MGPLVTTKLETKGEAGSFRVNLLQPSNSTHFAVITRLTRSGIPDVYCQYFRLE